MRFSACARFSDGETLLRLALLYGPAGLSLRSVAGLAAGTQLAVMSDVAVMKRLINSANFLEALVTAMLNERCCVGGDAGTRDLVLIDGTVIGNPAKAGKDWLLHTRFTPGRGFSGFDLTDRSCGETLARHDLQAGDIVVADRAYARGGKGLRHGLEQGADFIVRSGWRSLALRDEQGQPFDLLAQVRGLAPGETADLRVWVVVGKGQDMLPIRMVVEAKPHEATQATAKKVARKAQKNSRKGDPRSAQAAGYMFIATSLDAQDYPPAKVLELYRMRWQIELAFKRLKSLLNIDRLPAKQHNLARTWLYAHLLLALLIDDITQQLLDSPPCA